MFCAVLPWQQSEVFNLINQELLLLRRKLTGLEYKVGFNWWNLPLKWWPNGKCYPFGVRWFSFAIVGGKIGNDGWIVIRYLLVILVYGSLKGTFTPCAITCLYVAQNKGIPFIVWYGACIWKMPWKAISSRWTRYQWNFSVLITIRAYLVGIFEMSITIAPYTRILFGLKKFFYALSIYYVSV